jgi:hypothetical protein
MKGGKALDGKRVLVLRDLTNKRGDTIRAGEEAIFVRVGVVRCALRTDDGRFIARIERADFRPLEEGGKP